MIDSAKEFYGKEFDEVFNWHRDNGGWIISTEIFFGMGYFLYEDGDCVLHVSYVSGDMHSLFRFSLDYEIDKIRFSRSMDADDKYYDFDKFKERLCR